MSAFDDFINGLEGKDEIDTLEVVRELSKLHNEEVGIHTAKIEELNGFIAEKDNAIADLGNELTSQKAKNYDIISAQPAFKVNEPGEREEINSSNITIDDLFESGK